MKNKYIILLLLVITLAFTGCSSMGNTSSNDGNTSSQLQSHYNIDDETQFFAVGLATINESGNAVAEMKAKEEAKKKLNNIIYNKAKNDLQEFFDQIKNKSIETSSSTINDLAQYIALKISAQATQTNAWEENNQAFVVLAIKKDVIPDKSKVTFVEYVKRIIQSLNKAIDFANSSIDNNNNNNNNQEVKEVKSQPVSKPEKKDEVEDSNSEKKENSILEKKDGGEKEPEVEGEGFLEDF